MFLGLKVFKFTMFIIPAILSFLVLLWFLALILNSYPSISTGAKWGIFGG